MTYFASKKQCPAVLAATVLITLCTIGCGNKVGEVATQDELSRYIQEHPELKDSSSDEGVKKKDEAAPAKSAGPRTDA